MTSKQQSSPLINFNDLISQLDSSIKSTSTAPPRSSTKPTPKKQPNPSTSLQNSLSKRSSMLPLKIANTPTSKNSTGNSKKNNRNSIFHLDQLMLMLDNVKSDGDGDGKSDKENKNSVLQNRMSRLEYLVDESNYKNPNAQIDTAQQCKVNFLINGSKIVTVNPKLHFFQDILDQINLQQATSNIYSNLITPDNHTQINLSDPISTIFDPDESCIIDNDNIKLLALEDNDYDEFEGVLDGYTDDEDFFGVGELVEVFFKDPIQGYIWKKSTIKSISNKTYQINEDDNTYAHLHVRIIKHKQPKNNAKLNTYPKGTRIQINQKTFWWFGTVMGIQNGGKYKVRKEYKVEAKEKELVFVKFEDCVMGWDLIYHDLK